MWIEVHQSLPTHKKTLKLIRLLGQVSVDEVVGMLVSFWLWAVNNLPDGKLIEQIDNRRAANRERQRKCRERRVHEADIAKLYENDPTLI